VYTATSDTTFWVDSATGYVMDVHRKQTIAASPPSALAGLPLRAQFSLELQYASDSIYAAVKGAGDARQGLYRFGTLAPLGLLLVALILAVLAIWPFGRRRKRAAVDKPAAAEPVPVPD
jgi:hypothetical protein